MQPGETQQVIWQAAALRKASCRHKYSYRQLHWVKDLQRQLRAERIVSGTSLLQATDWKEVQQAAAIVLPAPQGFDIQTLLAKMLQATATSSTQLQSLRFLQQRGLQNSRCTGQKLVGQTATFKKSSYKHKASYRQLHWVDLQRQLRAERLVSGTFPSAGN